MQDDDLDALAAEYVLGTLASDERAHAEALIAIDPGFADIVHQWERRLGELNVMVEAVEPPAELWDKIKAGVGKLPPSDEVRLAPIEPSPPSPASASSPPAVAELPASGATAPSKAESNTDSPVEAKGGGKAAGEDSPLLAALASTLLAPEGQAEAAPTAKPQTKPSAGFSLLPPSPPSAPRTRVEGGADVFYLAHRLRRWRQIGIGTGALAAVLALFIVLTQATPGLFPAGIIHLPQLFSQASAPGSAPGNQFVAVLQQDPSSPAFLLTIDPSSRTLTVRTVAAKAAAGHSFELWLIDAQAGKPRSLGLVGTAEYTQRPLPAGFDADAIATATYAISFEPAGGSKTGAPTGPILFTGKPVQSVPPTPRT